MTPIPFDTLGASKQLREAGMPEGVAEAVVSVFQHATAMPDISHLTTKEDLVLVKNDLFAVKDDLKALRAEMATKEDLRALRAEMATKEDLKALRDEMVTKEALAGLRAGMATRDELAQVRLEIANLHASLNDTIRQQGWLIMGGVGVLVTISNSMLKIFA